MTWALSLYAYTKKSELVPDLCSQLEDPVGVDDQKKKGPERREGKGCCSWHC